MLSIEARREVSHHCNKTEQKSSDPVRGVLTFCKLAPVPFWHLEQSGQKPMLVEQGEEGGGGRGILHRALHAIGDILCLFSCKTLRLFLKTRKSYGTIRIL